MQAQPTAERPRAQTLARDGPVLRFARPIGRFLVHFAEMCAVMCVGAIALSVAFFEGAYLIGYPDLVHRFPELSTLVIAINLSLPMAAWMRFRGHEWRPTLEMSGATMAVGILLIGGFWLGIVPKSSLLEWQLRLACPVMLVVMLIRFGVYSGRVGHDAHAH